MPIRITQYDNSITYNKDLLNWYFSNKFRHTKQRSNCIQKTWISYKMERLRVNQAGVRVNKDPKYNKIVITTHLLTMTMFKMTRLINKDLSRRRKLDSGKIQSQIAYRIWNPKGHLLNHQYISTKAKRPYKTRKSRNKLTDHN